MTINVFVLTLLGLVALLLGANYLVKNIVLLAKKINVSEFLIASCSIAFGTTMPELSASLQAILSNPPHPGIAVGNLIGSNIANILLILGTAAIILPITISSKKLLTLEASISFIIILFPASIVFFKLQQNTSFYISIFMILFFFYSFLERAKLEKKEINKNNIKEPTFFIILKIIFCIIALLIGSRYLVEGAVKIAEYFDISERVIGLSLLAIGTSLPELFTAIMSSIKKISGITLGTVLGANTYNILGILSVVEIIQPSSILKNVKNIDIFLLFISSALLFIFLINKKINKLIGLIFLFIYILYINRIY